MSSTYLFLSFVCPPHRIVDLTCVGISVEKYQGPYEIIARLV